MMRIICRGLARIVVLTSSAAVLANLPGCGRETYVVLEEPMSAVARVETNSQALQVWADAGARADVLIHIDAIDDISIFPRSLRETMKNASDHLERKNSAVVDQIVELIENGGTVNLGYGAGMFDRVVWVVPAADSLPGLLLDEFRRSLIESRGFPGGVLEDLRQAGNRIEGSIAGIPLTVTIMSDLGPVTGTALIDMDLSYFAGKKGADPGYALGTASLLDFLRELRSKRISAELVTINRSSVGRRAPLDIRYFADIIKDALVDPTVIREPLGEKFQKMIRGEAALVSGDFAGAEKIYSDLTSSYPNLAGLHFFHAFALGFLDRGPECREAMVSAYELDHYYLEGIFQLARILGANGHVEAGEVLLDTPELRSAYSKLEIDNQRGLFYVQAGDYMNARTILVNVAANRPNDFSVRTVLYRVYEELGDTKRMPLVLNDLLRIDRQRVERDMPWVLKKLGDLAWNSHLDGLAAGYYSDYLELVPEDGDAVMMRDVIERVRHRTSSPDPGR